MSRTSVLLRPTRSVSQELLVIHPLHQKQQRCCHLASESASRLPPPRSIHQPHETLTSRVEWASPCVKFCKDGSRVMDSNQPPNYPPGRRDLETTTLIDGLTTTWAYLLGVGWEGINGKFQVTTERILLIYAIMSKIYVCFYKSFKFSILMRLLALLSY